MLANHTTNYDPILAALSFPQHMYFVASEHVYRWGLASKLIAWAFAPIARQKGATDASTVMKVIRTLRAGTNVAIFAEGNRTFNGTTGPIRASTGKLVKASGAGLVTFRLEGGFFTAPRWGASIRKGRMQGTLVKVYTPADIQAMSAEEVQAAIEQDLYEDAYARQGEECIPYKGKRLAESLEISLYICPLCGQVGTLQGRDNALLCNCGLHAIYTEYGMLEGDGLPFSTITQWDAWQLGELRARVAADSSFALEDDEQQLFLVESGKGNTLLAEGRLSMTQEAITCGDNAIAMQDISDIEIIARMTLVFSTKAGVQYELRSERPRSATKYLAYYQILQEQR